MTVDVDFMGATAGFTAVAASMEAAVDSMAVVATAAGIANRKFA